MALFDRLRGNAGTRTSKQVSGDAAEDAALAFLCGEIDLIMQDGDTLVFVEVRQRSKDSFGGALASVTRAKQRRLIVAAQIFLQRYRMPPACRFDVIGYDGDRMNWLKNAVEATPEAF